MAKDWNKLATEVVELVGGEANISSITHCVTRLRFQLKDESIANDDAISALDGVIQVMHANGQYQDAQGRRKYQGTFVGFFPADKPQYSVICMVYSKPTSKQFQGGGIPAAAIRTVVDELYNIDPCFRDELRRSTASR